MDKKISDAITILANHYAELATGERADLKNTDFMIEYSKKYEQIARSLGYDFGHTGNVAHGWYHPALL